MSSTPKLAKSLVLVVKVFFVAVPAAVLYLKAQMSQNNIYKKCTWSPV